MNVITEKEKKFAELVYLEKMNPFDAYKKAEVTGMPDHFIVEEAPRLLRVKRVKNYLVVLKAKKMSEESRAKNDATISKRAVISENKLKPTNVPNSLSLPFLKKDVRELCELILDGEPKMAAANKVYEHLTEASRRNKVAVILARPEVMEYLSIRRIQINDLIANKYNITKERVVENAVRLLEKSEAEQKYPSALQANEQLIRIIGAYNDSLEIKGEFVERDKSLENKEGKDLVEIITKKFQEKFNGN